MMSETPSCLARSAASNAPDTPATSSSGNRRHRTMRTNSELRGNHNLERSNHAAIAPRRGRPSSGLPHMPPYLLNNLRMYWISRL